MGALPELGERIVSDPQPFECKDKILKAKFGLPLDNFYQTCPITRASKTMADCVGAFVKGKAKRLAA